MVEFLIETLQIIKQLAYFLAYRIEAIQNQLN
jgi:hypothetical protein